MMDTTEGISFFFDSLYDYAEQQKELKDKWKLVEKLEEELDTSRTSYTALSSNLKRCLESDDFNINTKCVKLKEKHESIHKEIEALEEQLKKLKVDTSEEKERIVLETDRKIKAEEELAKNKILELKAQIEKRKTEHRQKLEQLNNELELARAAADLEQDEMETTLRRELINLKTKIWRQRKANDDLRVQIDDLRSRQQKASTTYDDSIFLHEDVLNVFQLKQLDDLFQQNLTDNTKEQDNENSHLQSYQHIPVNSENVNALQDIDKQIREHQTVTSKYQPLNIIRRTNRNCQSGGDNNKNNLSQVDSKDVNPNLQGHLGNHNAAFVNYKHNIVDESKQFEIGIIGQEYQTYQNANAKSIKSKKKSTKTAHAERYDIEECNLSTDSSVIFLNNNGNTININTTKKKTHQEKVLAKKQISSTLLPLKSRNPMNKENRLVPKDYDHIQKFDNKEFLKPRNQEIKTGNKKPYHTKQLPRETDMFIFKYPKHEQSTIQSDLVDSNMIQPVSAKRQQPKTPSSIVSKNQPSKNYDGKNERIENTKKGQTGITMNKIPVKKRKLFNMNDLDYLDSIQIHSDQWD